MYCYITTEYNSSMTRQLPFGWLWWLNLWLTVFHFIAINLASCNSVFFHGIQKQLPLYLPNEFYQCRMACLEVSMTIASVSRRDALSLLFPASWYYLCSGNDTQNMNTALPWAVGTTHLRDSRPMYPVLSWWPVSGSHLKVRSFCPCPSKLTIIQGQIRMSVYLSLALMKWSSKRYLRSFVSID